MSTFKGIVTEFPDIRIDYFRRSDDPDARPPLACFLTHIHSDHIQGLEGFYGGPFIHCSAATKELLIRLERRTHRWNFAKGVLEVRKCQYAEKEKKLKVIPLETPTMVEVGNGKSLRVTLFDANHCPGAVMFLIEGEDKSILYTGDIRAERWWVEYLIRHPLLIPYTMGMKKLDKIYLDTTFACRKRTHEVFKSKHDGIFELLETIKKYPSDTVFHLNTWTFGYEDVWVALAAAFDTKIHLSDYHRRLFHFIKKPDKYPHGPFISGFEFGNAKVLGCTTSNVEARFHSCERRLGCRGLEGKRNVVWITPVVTRMGSLDVHEPGAGHGDLESQDDLVLNGEHLDVLLNALGPDIPEDVKHLLSDARTSMGQSLRLSFSSGAEGDELSGARLLGVLSEAVAVTAGRQSQEACPPKPTPQEPGGILADNGKLLPKSITFPYSRHSSYSELRGLIAAFHPRDIYPCVINENSWDEEQSIEALFGDLCTPTADGGFSHDKRMKRRLEEERMLQEQLAEEWARCGLESQVKLNRSQEEIYLQGTKRRLCRDYDDDEYVKKEKEAGEGEGEPDDLWAKIKTMGSSTASCTPVTSPLATPKKARRWVPKDEDATTPTPQTPEPYPASPAPRRIKKERSPPRESSVEREFSESGRFWEAVEAAAGVAGRSWWDVGVGCTMSQWRYQEEMEL